MPLVAYRVAAWLAFFLAVALHIAFWRGWPLAMPGFVALLVAFLLAAFGLMGAILYIQAGGPGPTALPGPTRWVLGLGFIYVALNLIDWFPVGGGTGGGNDPAAFERAFSAILAWQGLAAAFYHTLAPRLKPPA